MPRVLRGLAQLSLACLSLLVSVPALSTTLPQHPLLQNPPPSTALLQSAGVEQTGTGQTPGHSQRVKPGEVPTGLSGSDWAAIQAQIAARKYRAYAHQHDGFVAANPAHGWQIHYATDGSTTLRPRADDTQAYHLGLKLRAVGIGELQALDHPQQISSDAATVSYQWNNNLREWWVNNDTGLEQWFELEQRPPGAASGQPLRLEMTLQTDLVASQNGNALAFVSAGSAATTISYTKLKAWDASGRVLPARMQLHANQLSLVIDDTAAHYPVTIDPSFAQQAYLKASNTGGSDNFGLSVAISGDSVVVGARWEDSSTTGVNSTPNESADQSGAAYVFTRSGTTWTEQAYLKASNTGGGDQFGTSVAISGDSVVVGAPFEASSTTGVNSTPDNGAGESGAAYVFTRSGTTWSEQAYLKASNTGGDDQFGTSVAISGDSVVVGARFEDSSTTGVNSTPDDGAGDAGAAYVFTRSGTTWTQQAYLKASNTGGDDQFGFSVAISGDSVVVGANLEDSSTTGVNSTPNEGAFDSGAAYVFTRSGTTWTQQAYLKASNTGVFDLFGYSVAISGDSVVVGANNEASSTTGVNSIPDELAVDSGAAYVFTRSGTTWTQQAYLKASNTGGFDFFGNTVAISGDSVVVGAFFEDSSTTGVNSTPDEGADASGAAYVFTRSGTTWTQQAYLKASNTGGDDRFGWSVAISGDSVVVGAFLEDSSTTGVNSTPNDGAGDAGAAYVFHIPRPPVFLNNNDRLGDAGIFQYYTVNGGWQTFIRVINTSAEAVSVKVRFREAANSREVLDFIIFLSPYDMWSGWTDTDPTDGVTDSGSTAVLPGLRTNDTSCLFPLPNGNNTAEGFKTLAGGGLGADFQSRAYSGAYADGGAAFHTDLERMSEGHLEMIGIASHPALSTFGLAVTHNQATGMPTNCSQAADLFSAQVIGSATRTTADTDLPNVLAFNGYVINVSKGQAGGFDPDVLADFHNVDGPGTLVDAALATATDPDMDSASGIITPTARIKQKGKSGPTAVLGGVDAVSWLFQRTGVINEWAASANPLAIVKDYYTQWVLTFFTRHYYVDLQDDPDPADDISPTLADPDDDIAANNAYMPFNEEFDQGVTAGHACEPYRMRIFNREEANRSFTSPAPSTPVEICDETNVLVFHENYASEGLKSNFSVTVPTQLLPVDAGGTTSERGWALLDFWAPGSAVTVNSVLKGGWVVMNNVGGGIPGIPDAILNRRFLTSGGETRRGLPVTGWMLSVYNTGAADTNHTNINAHKYAREDGGMTQVDPPQL